MIVNKAAAINFLCLPKYPQIVCHVQVLVFSASVLLLYKKCTSHHLSPYFLLNFPQLLYLTSNISPNSPNLLYQHKLCYISNHIFPWVILISQLHRIWANVSKYSINSSFGPGTKHFELYF